MKRRRLALASLALLLAAAPADAQAQERGSQGDGGNEVQWLRVNGWGGEVGVRGQATFTDSRYGSTTKTITRQSTYLLDEHISLDLDGSVYHPRFLTWDVGGGVSLVQGWSTQSRIRDRKGDGVRYEYDGQIRLLPSHAYGLDLSARRVDDEVLDLYVDSVRVIQESYGAQARWRGPVEFGAYARWNDYDERGRAVRRETRATAGASARYDGAAGVLDLNYEYLKVQDHLYGQSYQTNRASLTHFLRTETDDELKASRHSLSTRGLAQDQRGVTDYSLFSWGEDYTYRPMRALRFDLSGSWAETQVAKGFTSRNLLASGGVTHRLYESLTTQLGANMQRWHSRRSNQDSVGGSWSTSYSKDVPYGRLNLSYSGSLNRTERKDAGAARFVLDEQVTLTDGAVTVLLGEALVPGSVFVTDTAGTTAYVEGIDYQLLPVGRSTRVLRLAGGGITNGQTVSVDYTHLGGGDTRYDTQSHSFNASVRLFDLLSPFYRWSVTRPKRLDSSTGTLPDRRLSQSWGVKLSWRWFEVGYEGADVRSQRTPYRSNAYTTRLTLKPMAKVSLGLDGSYTVTTYARQVDRTASVRLQSDWTATDQLNLRLEGLWEKRQVARRNYERLALISEVNWRYGRFEASLTGRYLHRTEERTIESDDLRLAIEITRRF